MRVRKGFTLVEVIVALALIGIIAITTLPVLSGYFKMLSNTKNITKDVFQAQQNVEIEIDNVKGELRNGNTPTDQTDYTLFAYNNTYKRTVKAYPRNTSFGPNSKNVFTIIADTRMPSYKVAVVSNVVTKKFKNNIESKKAYAAAANLKLSSTFSISDPDNVNLVNIHRWYVSREGFNIPVIQSPDDEEVGIKYPNFPDDYSLILSETNNKLDTNLKKYAGRHIVHTITPASKLGKMGVTVPGKPVFLEGIPIIDNLALHLDAAMIDKEDSTAVRTTIVNTKEVQYVKVWDDMSGNSNNAEQTVTNNQPQLVEEAFGKFVTENGKNTDVYAKYLKFDGNQSITIPDDSTLDLDNMTVFVVARSISTAKDKAIISKRNSSTNDNYMWRLGWNDTNKLGFYMRDNATNDSSDFDTNEGLDGQWHVFMSSVDNNNVEIGTDDSIEKSKKKNVKNSITNNQPIRIGWDSRYGYSTVDVAEIIMYSSINPNEKKLVREYLMKKYRPKSITIDSIEAIPEETRLVKEPYIMPSTVSAHLSNNTVCNLPVTWASPPTINTSSAGKKTSTGTATLNGSSKTTILTVNVLGIEEIKDFAATVEKGETYYPRAIAKLSNGTEQEIDIDWDPAINTNILGTTEYNGKAVLNSSKKVKLNLTVINPVLGVSLNKSKARVSVGESQTLVATINPSDATNKEMSWESSNPGIAKVVNGIVTGIADGPTTITVTTAYGNKKDTCLVTVGKPINIVKFVLSNKYSERTGGKGNRVYHIYADVAIHLSDGVIYQHGRVEERSSVDYPTKINVSGNAIDSWGEKIPYSESINFN